MFNIIASFCQLLVMNWISCPGDDPDGENKMIIRRPSDLFTEKEYSVSNSGKIHLMLLILVSVSWWPTDTVGLRVSLSDSVGLDGLRLSYLSLHPTPGPGGQVYFIHILTQLPAVSYIVELLYKGKNWWVPQQGVQGPAATTQHRQCDLHPGLSDGEACL